MPIVYECKCGLTTPVPEAQGNRRHRCKGCGTIALVAAPEVLNPDPVVATVVAGPPDSTPAPPPPKPRKPPPPTPEEEREDYPRTGGVIDWRKVYDGDEDDYHRDPIPPDPQTRYLNPADPSLPWRVARGITGGLMLLGGASVLVLDLLLGGPSCLSAVAGVLTLAGGGLAFGAFRRRY